MEVIMKMRLTGPELAIVTESVKHLDLTHAIKLKVLYALSDYARESIAIEKSLDYPDSPCLGNDSRKQFSREPDLP